MEANAPPIAVITIVVLAVICVVVLVLCVREEKRQHVRTEDECSPVSGVEVVTGVEVYRDDEKTSKYEDNNSSEEQEF